MDSVTGASRRQLARIAGALYLINVVGGAFAIGYIRSPVVAPMRRMAQEELEELICLAEVLKPSA
jgi:hypothetical protein